MQNLVNKEQDIWVRPWNKTKFDDLDERDERFLSLVIKGALGWLTRNIVLYNKSIRHYIFNTGSSYMYVEYNGYEFIEGEVTGEDMMYMSIPRCVCQLGEISIPTEELTSQFVRGTYERLSSKDNQIKGYNAEIRRIPLELTLSLNYVLSNFNESLILIQELIDKLVFQKYFRIVYLGEVIQCSIEFPTSTKIEFNKIDMSTAEDRNKHINFDIKICTSYPQVDTASECSNENIIGQFGIDMNIYGDMKQNPSDIEKTTIS